MTIHERQNRKTNILLLSVSGYLALCAIRALNPKKYNIYCIGPGKEGIRFSKFHKRYFICSAAIIENADMALLNMINMFSIRYKIDVIIPLDLPSTICIATWRKQLTTAVFPVPSLDNILLLNNKWTTSTLMRTLWIPHPETRLIKNANELINTTLSKPFLIKPTMQSGGKGIVRINNVNDIKTYMRTFSPYKAFPLIVQRYIPGDDIDLSLLAKDGIIIAWTIQKWNGFQRLEFVENSEVLSIGKKIVRHTRFNGLMHIDMRKDKKTNRIFLIECNSRAWGSMYASIYAGVNFIQLGIECAKKKQLSSTIQQKTTYEMPRRLLARLYKNPLKLFAISSASKKDLIDLFSDPIPYILLLFEEIKSRTVSHLNFDERTRIK